MEKVNVMREPTWSYTKLNYSEKAPSLNEKKIIKILKAQIKKINL